MSTSLFRRRACGALILLCGRPADAQQPPAARRGDPIVGCYRLSLGPWSMQSTLGPARETTVIRLDTIARVPGAPGDLVAERVEPPEVLLPTDPRVRWQQPAQWRREGPDSIVITLWSTGTEAEVFMGHRVGATLQGVVRRGSDAIPIDPATKKIRRDALPYAVTSAMPTSCP